MTYFKNLVIDQQTIIQTLISQGINCLIVTDESQIGYFVF